MPTVNDFKLEKGQRGIIIGRTGTGKTHLAKFLIPTEEPIALFDPKRELDYKDNRVKIYHSLTAIKVRQPDRFMYRPSEDDVDNLRMYSDVLKWCYAHPPRFVYLDDMVGILDQRRYPRYLQIAYQMGRQRNVQCLACTQRPAFVPGFLMSESSKFYVFHLHYPSDVKKVQEMVPGYEPDLLLDNPHAFFYYDHKMPVARRYVMPAKTPQVTR